MSTTKTIYFAREWRDELLVTAVEATFTPKQVKVTARSETNWTTIIKPHQVHESAEAALAYLRARHVRAIEFKRAEIAQAERLIALIDGWDGTVTTEDRSTT